MFHHYAKWRAQVEPTYGSTGAPGRTGRPAAGRHRAIEPANGNVDAGRTDSDIDVILPVVVEMVIVAGVSRSLITAREDAMTVIS